MLKDFLNYIESEKLFNIEDKILLAVSGGIDSVVLCELMHKSIFNFAIAHCNFGLRGKESDLDESFVISIAEELGVPIFVEHFKTNKYAKEHNISTQMAARNLRYKWFDKLLNENDYQYLATAHHINDSIETSIFNFTKGTGIAGLRGMLAKNGRKVRPLLFANREQIYQYATEHDIIWREDQSNTTDKYIRNSIRINVIPHLQKINPSLEGCAENTFKRLRDVELIFNKQIELFKKEAITQEDHDTYISIDRLNFPGSRTILFEFLKNYGFNFSQIEDLTYRLAEIGKVYISQSHILNVDRDHLIVSQLNKNNWDITFHIQEEDEVIMLPNGRLEIDWQAKKPQRFKNNKNIAYIDKEKLTFPLTIRKWKQGDKFYPLGMSGKKKLSDFMIDEKIPLNLKERVFVVQSGKDIVWVVGHRIDDRYKVTDDSSALCKIEMIQLHD